MSKSITISKKTPASKSMQYDVLRDEGIKHIEKLSGKIWTDYNTHDPGVTILEVLSYAITELGYRSNYAIKDLIMPPPDEEGDIKNFFTARQILPNSPVTIDDYRKLLIDVEVHDPSSNDCEHVGVRNAWIQKSRKPGIPIYVHKNDSQLQYIPDPKYVGDGDQPNLDIGILYDILLEFEKCEAYGDLNENTIIEEYTVESHSQDELIEGLIIKIKVEFPRWDNQDVDWEDVLSIKNEVQNITINFIKEPSGYEFEYEIVNNSIKLDGRKITSSDTVDIPGIESLETALNNYVYHDTDGLTINYLQKIKKINLIMAKVKAQLNANRNLCEDFVRFSALKVEKIAVCADIELETEANVDMVQAQIFHEIAKFFSPPVNFYSLSEMLDKCKTKYELSIKESNVTDKYFLVKQNDLSEALIKGDGIYVSGSTSNDGEYTIRSITNSNQGQKIFVDEDIPSDLLSEGEMLSYYLKEESQCLTVDEIFEGPALDHGFIDKKELALADRKEYIHVSDLIQIIMKIDGVLAVKSIQIANLPQDNENGDIKTVSVRWCMKLAFEQNYVPRLSKLNSKITFYKEQLPFKASLGKVDELVESLEAKERVPRLYKAKLDFDVPRGVYQNPETYSTIQNDFPLTYGVGHEGLPEGRSSTDLRKAQSKQLKGFLMFFDQLLANFFSQLAHVKDLFSMNAEKDQSGKYLIGRTYYTQPLFDIPDIDELFVDKLGHLVALNNIAEDEERFGIRKNKFLDHLLGRFGEEFTDYALLTFKITGEERAPEELIDDKLTFLNAYPQTGSRRGTAIDHQAPCKLWHVDNVSGITRRGSFLAGIAPRHPDRLKFGPNFSITENSGDFIIEVSDDSANVLLTSSLNSMEEAVQALEIFIINGVTKGKYVIVPNGAKYMFTLSCGGDEIGTSTRVNFPDKSAGGVMDQTIDLLVTIFSKEFFNNIESNRNNLSCAFDNYFKTEITIDMVPDPPTYTISFELFGNPFDFTTSNKLLSGSFTFEGEAKAEVDILSVDITNKKFVIDGNISNKLEPGDILKVDHSSGNDGNYTVKVATEAGDETTIEVEEAIANNTVPLGELFYNTISESDLLKEAEAELPNFLWEVIQNAHDADQYSFSPSIPPYTSNYVFKINNRFGEEFAVSIQKNFNKALANELKNLTSDEVVVSGSSTNDGVYRVTTAVVDGPFVKVTVDSSIVSTVADGKMSFTETYAFTVDTDNNGFLIPANIGHALSYGDSVTISGSDSNDGNYEIIDIQVTSGKTLVKVNETIPSSADSGEFNYSKLFTIHGIDGDQFIIIGGCDQKAVLAMVDFIHGKFFDHEGFHIMEHVLLRPRVKGCHFVETMPSDLDSSLANQGMLVYEKTVDLFSASNQTNKFRIQGDFTSEIDRFNSTADIASEIKVTGTNINDGKYKVRGVQYESANNRTAVRVYEQIITDIPSSGSYGQIIYHKRTSILTIVDLKIKVEEPEVLLLEQGDIISIVDSAGGINDGRYKIKQVVKKGTKHELTVSHVEKEIEDKPLDIVIEEDECDACKIEDPYTCIASVVLPHWQGRFDNIDFRKFFERQLRLEAPAHVFLNVCWISCDQMAQFEKCYKSWLIENARRQVDLARLSAAQRDLANILANLRNIYPVGTLHDCEKDDALDNAIILDNSVLGNA
jgi:hypothetical protein